MKKLLIPILIILIAGVAWYATREDTTEMRDEDTEADIVVQEEGIDINEDVVDYTPGDFRDGTYQSLQMYRVPNGQVHDVDVTLTLENDEIVDYVLKFDDGVEGGSTDNQVRFAQALRGLLSGQEIDELNLSRVGGASLTTDSFNDALDDVMVQASVSS